MGSYGLPALHVNPPEQPDLLGNLGKIMQLRNMQQQGQIGQQQIQQGQQQLQQGQMDLDSQKALQDAYKQASGDPDKTLQIAAQSGKVKPQALLQWQQMATEQKLKTMQLVNEQGAKALRDADLIKGAYDSVAQSQNKPMEYQKQLMGLQRAGVDISQFPPQYPGDQGFEFLGAVATGHKQQVEDALKQADIQKTQAQTGQAQAATATSQAELPGKMAESQAKAKFAMPQAQAELGKTRAQTAESTAQAKKALLEAGNKPVYAMDESGQRVLMSQGDAVKSGSHVIIPVTEAQIKDDIMLNNRLADVQQKIARYEQSMKTNLSASDKGNIAALLGTSGFKLGVSHTEIPLERLNSALQGENLSKLSPAGRTALVAYKNAREAMVGYQRVLSGSGRSSEQQMQLNIQTLPDPGISDAQFAAESFKQFKENLGIVGQGLPKIPGIKNPSEVGAAASQPDSNDPFAAFGGRAR